MQRVVTKQCRDRLCLKYPVDPMQREAALPCLLYLFYIQRRAHIIPLSGSCYTSPSVQAASDDIFPSHQTTNSVDLHTFRYTAASRG